MTRTHGAVCALVLAGCPASIFRSAATISAADLPADPAILRARAAALDVAGDSVSLENELVVFGKLQAQEPRSYPWSWQTSRVALSLADGAKEPVRRRHFAQLGVDAARQAIALDDKPAEGHYYLAACLGYVAQTQTIGAVLLLPEVVRHAQAADQIDPHFDHAGPARLLGAVYLRAPGWPASVGDPEEALSQLSRAVSLDGNWAPNRVFLAEALVANDRLADAEVELARVMTDGRLTERWRDQALEVQRKLRNKRGPKGDRP